MSQKAKGPGCGCKHAGQAPVYTGDDTASIHEPSAPVYTGDDLASIYGEESAPYKTYGGDGYNRGNDYGDDSGDDDQESFRGSSLDDRDDRPLEKQSPSEKEKKKYMMTKPQRKYMTRNSAGCLVSTLCIAMLILVLTTMALFIWLFLFHLPSNNDYIGYCRPVRNDSGGICVQECNNNGECSGKQLCCSNGCGRVCVDPAPVVINLNVTLNQSYDEVYRDKMSTQYRLLQRDYINIINEIISNDNDLGEYHIETTVSDIRPGSVKIVSWLTFDIDVGDKLDISEDLSKNIAELISKESENGQLGRLEGDVVDVDVSKPLDPADGGPIGPPPPPRPTGDTQSKDPLGTGICGTRPGVGRPQSRIVGGDEVDIESVPWIGSLWNDDGHYIGAVTLLNQEWAVTAASSIINSPSYVVFGLEDLNDHSRGSRRDGIPISVFIPHPSAKYGSINHNIALIKLARPVIFSNQVRPACFGTSMDEPTAYQTCRTAGFGGDSLFDFVSVGGENYNQLHQREDVPVHSTKTCQDVYAAYDFGPFGEFFELDYNHICAGDPDSGDGNACWGDSGVPLMCLGDDDLWRLVGVSALISCNSYPTAYSRISTYSDFILDAITSTESCLGFNNEECSYQCGGGIDCAPTRCSDPGLFQCDLGPCIPTRLVCNDQYDCWDNSDEAVCSACGNENISLEPDQVYQLSYPVYAPFAPVGVQNCHWLVSVSGDRRIQISFVGMSLVSGDLLTVNTGDRILYFDGTDDDLSDVYSASSSVDVSFQTTSQTTQSTFWLQFRAHDAGSELCSYDEFQCHYTSLFCIDINHVCDGERHCPDGDDEQDCPDECGDEYINLYPGDTHQLTSVNWPDLYPENSYCHWVIQTQPGRLLLLHFANFALQDGDYLTINLDGAIYTDAQPRQAGGGQTSPITNLRFNFVNLTGVEIPRDLLSKGHAVTISMVTNGYGVQNGGYYGFVLEIRDTDGTDVAACSDGYVIQPTQVCNDVVDCPDNSDEAPCQCGDLPREVYLHTTDTVTLTSYKYPFHEYTNSLKCHWMFTANAGYRLLVHFDVFNLEEKFDFLTIRGTNHAYPSVAYTGNTLPPEIESPSNFLLIWFETDEKNGAVGFSLTVSVAQAAGRPKCDNQLELLPDNDLHGICDGIPHCYDGSDEKEECKCMEEDEFYMTPDQEALFFASANYPLNYLPDTSCQYTIITYQGYHILAHFIDLHLEKYYDFVNIDAGNGEYIGYTGSMSHNERALDALSLGNTMTIKFITDNSVQDIGYRLQINVVSGNYGDGHKFCENKIQLLPDELVCDMIYDCADYSDEETCVDIFNTGICGTRPVVDDLRILNGEDALDGELPWTGRLDSEDGSCGATLINEYWAVTAAHCLEDAEQDSELRVIFGDRNGYYPTSPHRQVVEVGMYFIDQDYTVDGVKYDFGLIRFKRPVKVTDHVRPACIAATKDEVNYYKECKVAGWGYAFQEPAGPASSSFYEPSILQTDDPHLLPLDHCEQLWDDYNPSLFSSAAQWENPDWPMLCAGVDEPEQFIDVCFGDSGSGLTCLGDDGRWHLVGVAFLATYNCRQGIPSLYTRLSSYRKNIADFIRFTDRCVGGDEPPECHDYLDCNGGPDCPPRGCTEDEFQCANGQCIPAEDLCNTEFECYDYSDENAPYCFSDCGGDEIFITDYQTYTLTSPNYPSLYPESYQCVWTVTSPPFTKILGEFTNFDMEDGYDFVTVGYDPQYIDFGGDSGRYAPHFYTGEVLPSSFLSPQNVFYVNFFSDSAITLQGFVLKFQVFTQYSNTPPLCGDNFQVYGGDAVVCDGVYDCLDGTDEATCVCPTVEALVIEPESYLFLSSPTDSSGNYYPNSLSCTWTVTGTRYIMVSVDSLDFDVYSDSVQVSSATGVEGVFTYDSEVYGFLFFKSNEVVVHLSTDSFYNEGFGFEITLYDTNGDDCVISTDPTCVQRPGCYEDCYARECSSGVEYYEASWFCDGVEDCRDGSDEPEACECGERDISLSAEGSYELSPPSSDLLPSTYRLDSDCQWTITTSTGYVLYAHFNHFKIEDGKKYVAYDDDLLYGDYLYAGIGSSAINYRKVTYTGSDVPLDLETPGNRLVLTFLSDETIAYEGFSVTIYSRHPAAQMKCDNELEIFTNLLRCNGIQDCHGEPTDEIGCP